MGYSVGYNWDEVHKTSEQWGWLDFERLDFRIVPTLCRYFVELQIGSLRIFEECCTWKSVASPEKRGLLNDVEIYT